MKSVLVIGLEPTIINFSSPDFAALSGVTAATIAAGLKADEARLKSLGYDPEMCLVDFGETAESVVRQRLSEKRFDCIVIGAGVRTMPSQFFLFEKLVNIVHAGAPQAKLCFNTKPTDTAEAVERWI